jgi:hypothetical protein
VLVAADVISQGPGGNFGAGGMTSDSGCPDSMRLMSGSGPFGPILNGVWQSWQPEVFTRYLPRAARSGVAAVAAPLASASAASSGAAGSPRAAPTPMAASSRADAAVEMKWRFIMGVSPSVRTGRG